MSPYNHFRGKDGNGIVIAVYIDIPLRSTIKEEGSTMSLVSLLIALVIVGVVLWLINTYIPMDGKIKKILNVVIVVFVIIWLLNEFGVLGSHSGIHMGNFHAKW
jgi:hypothetical protein